ncbi:ribonuclease III [Microbacterium sp. NPDC076911]|uniref:ribonuclease III n=1 Tax=Microbacterium sp. NPDC076911 TaxID=3154958 RepID=UPI003420670A
MTDVTVERSSLAELTQKLGVVIDPELLLLSLTHRSWAYENGQCPHNERLEFLGDSVLGQAVTVRLYTAHPDLDEGELAKRRASVVSTIALAEIARGFGLGAYLRLGRGEDQTGGRDKDSILADTTEAIFGAAYLSAGADEATALVLRMVEPLLADPARYGAAMDPKTSLQELAARTASGAPVYVVTAQGPDHDRRFTATVEVGDVTAQGAGSSKKQAEMAAALSAWHELSARA